MTKIFAIDYDGTFRVDEEQTRKNAEAFKDLRKTNNKIAFATGRPVNFIKNVEAKFDIDVDYYVCANGARVETKNGEIIFDSKIEDNDTNDIAKYIEKNINRIKVFDCTDGVNYYYEEVKKNMNAYTITPCKKEELHIMVSELKQLTNLDVFPSRTVLHIVNKDIDKTNAIKKVVNREKIEKDKVYVIGDSGNDYDMIKAFDGYTLEVANEENKKIAKKIYKNVAEFIEENK